MSFDLWVWREEEPVTTHRALLKYRWLTSEEECSGPEPEMVPDDRVGAFHTEIVSVYPPLVEYREGSAERHFRYVTGDFGEVVSAFQGFADGHEDGKASALTT